jgi:hypothetical protein
MHNLTSAMNQHLSLNRAKHINKLDKIDTKIKASLAAPTDYPHTQATFMSTPNEYF